jgi:hypothetical protein
MMVSSSVPPKTPSHDSKSRGLFSDLNHFVFWPPFLLLLSAIVLNFWAPDEVVDGVKLAGGFSALLQLLIIGALLRVVFFHHRLNCFSDSNCVSDSEVKEGSGGASG